MDGVRERGDDGKESVEGAIEYFIVVEHAHMRVEEGLNLLVGVLNVH